MPGFTRVLITALTGEVRAALASSLTMWTSSRPTSIGVAPWMRACRSGEASQALACSRLWNRCTITQSTCSGGRGGISCCSMKPGKAATTALVSVCHRAKASALSGRMVVCVTMLTDVVAPLMTRRASVARLSARARSCGEADGPRPRLRSPPGGSGTVPTGSTSGGPGDGFVGQDTGTATDSRGPAAPRNTRRNNRELILYPAFTT